MDLPTKIDFAKVNCRPQLDRANAADQGVGVVPLGRGMPSAERKLSTSLWKSFPSIAWPLPSYSASRAFGIPVAVSRVGTDISCSRPRNASLSSASTLTRRSEESVGVLSDINHAAARTSGVRTRPIAPVRGTITQTRRALAARHCGSSYLRWGHGESAADEEHA